MSNAIKKNPDFLDIRLKNQSQKDRSLRRDLTPEYDPDARPGPVEGVTLSFRIRERRVTPRYSAVVRWDPMAPGTCEADIHYFKIRIRATDENGNVLPVGDGRRKRGHYLVNDEDDLEPDELKYTFHDLEHPKRWYWQASVCVVDKANRKGEWSEWTTPELPHAEANPSPPVPQNVMVTFDKGEKGRGEARYRMLVKFDEIEFWDIPPTQDTDKVVHSLQGAHGAGATTLNFSSTTGFPQPNNKERVSLKIGYGANREIISYNNKTATQLQGVKRGLDGTTAKAWADNTDVILTAADAAERQNDLQRYECQIRRCDANGNWIKNDEDKFIQRMKGRSWDKEDDDNDGKVRIVFYNLRKRHKWQVRVRTTDRFNRKGDWSDWFPGLSPGSFSSPSDTTPPPMPTGLDLDVSPRKLSLIWNAPRDTEDQDLDDDLKEIDPDIAYFQVQASNRSDFNKALSSYWRNDPYHKTMHKTFRKKKTDRGPFHVRVRSVDASGNKSNWLTINKQRKKPGKVRNRSVNARTRAVVVRFDPPNAWEDGTNDEWDISEVSHYEVDLLRNGVLYEQDLQVLSTRKSFPIPKADAGGTFSTRIRAIGHEADFATEDAATGNTVPEGLGVGSGDIDPNAIVYNHLASTLGGLQAGFYGSTFESGSPPRTRLSSGPSGKNGDMALNLSESPPRMYKYENGTWWRATDGSDLTTGSLVADKITSGTLQGVLISGVTIEGSTIRTSSGNRIEMGPGIGADRLQFRNNTTVYATLRQNFTGLDFNIEGYTDISLRPGIGSPGSVFIHTSPAVSHFAVLDNDGLFSVSSGGAGGLEVNGGRVLVGRSNSTSNNIDLRNTGAGVAAPPTGFARVHYRGDLTPSELRVRFPSGNTKTIAIDN